MKRIVLTITVCLLLAACGGESSLPPQEVTVAIDSNVLLQVDKELAELQTDTTCTFRDDNWTQDGREKKVNTCLRKNQIVMVEEEEVVGSMARLNRYYFRDDELVYASSYTVDQCGDPSVICIDEVRCYFEKNEVLMELGRSLSIPMEEGLDGWTSPTQESLSTIPLQPRLTDSTIVSNLFQQGLQLKKQLSQINNS